MDYDRATRLLEVMFDVASQLKKLREDRGWTQEEMAERSAMALPTYIKKENGQRKIKPEDAERFARALGVEIGVIFGQPSEVKQIPIVRELQEVEKQLRYSTARGKGEMIYVVGDFPINTFAWRFDEITTILFNPENIELEDGGSYLVINNDEIEPRAYFSNPSRLEGVKHLSDQPTIYPEGKITVVGRIMSIQIDTMTHR